MSRALLMDQHVPKAITVTFSGIIYAHQLQVSIGTCVRDLELIAKVGEASDMMNQIQFLPF